MNSVNILRDIIREHLLLLAQIKGVPESRLRTMGVADKIKEAREDSEKLLSATVRTIDMNGKKCVAINLPPTIRPEKIEVDNFDDCVRVHIDGLKKSMTDCIPSICNDIWMRSGITTKRKVLSYIDNNTLFIHN